MHWILQGNMINPASLAQLRQALGEQDVGYSLVKAVPIFNVLMEPAPEVQGPVFVYGSTGLGDIAKQHGWQPGYFDANLDYGLMLAHYGDLALNAGARISSLADAVPLSGEFFIRPILDNKAFAGEVMTAEDLAEFRAGVASVADEPDTTVRLTDMVAVAPLVSIAAEYRFFVVKGKVVTGSRYKLGTVVQGSLEIPNEVAAFAQRAADQWIPNDACALDVAETSEGLRVIEVNSANSAGFYACDVREFVRAVNSRLS